MCCTLGKSAFKRKLDRACEAAALKATELSSSHRVLIAELLGRHAMANGDSGSSGILGVIIGVLLVIGLLYFFLGERIGLRSPGSTTVNVEVPKNPVTK